MADQAGSKNAPAGNAAFCESPQVYDRDASAIASLVDNTKLDVKSPTDVFLSITKSLIAGGVAGGVSRTAVAPLERLKILLQVQNSQNARYKGMFQGLRTIWNTEGVKGFFIGNGVNCARIVPNSAVKFLSYEHAANAILWAYRRETGDSEAELNPVLRLGAGACAGIIAMSATYPMDMIRGRLTVQTKGSESSYNGMLHAARTIVRMEGWQALYKGWLPSVIGVVPYVGLNFAVYESLKDYIVKEEPFGPVPGSELAVLTKLGCGAVAGATGQTVAYPLDVIRRRMQMGGWYTTTINGQKVQVHYNGMLDAFSQTVKKEGFTALYKGLVPNSVKVVPSIALAFVTYEIMKDLMTLEYRITD
ncbi:hypothetical protein SELMODRAFT_233298 [Selaginella moellendorffii]|uniref:Uncharacterized protein mBAC10-1 n=1 Tax=Selaginella moellendorffii TaxID=88036 RepID=D8S7H2_SELML|nr:mitochondrial adenine nucleotide transporter ADNT1 [Selaginella moellendorffii]XP_002992318.1 mitochondrial adenine nucleotide transporter ADNT1 [Selaginella moellendorffii]EFJ06594.1 hypothetical protein SELMODRAFT_186674 [Selaginella moellendorffii]EFJ19605.1 hypothetical protein SELMODRAFT_233298 [Selaginella moellendorffii]|eukprot:XP_002979197.1 mitochondrial adenine nucleotide transporter ADNT1 [Selaginella moellendorffii]